MNDYADRIIALADEIEGDGGIQDNPLSASLRLLSVSYQCGMIAVAFSGLGKVSALIQEMQRLGGLLGDESGNLDADIVDLLNKKRN